MPNVLPHTVRANHPPGMILYCRHPLHRAVRLPFRSADLVPAILVGLVLDKMHSLYLALDEYKHVLKTRIVSFRFRERAGVFRVDHGVVDFEAHAFEEQRLPKRRPRFTPFHGGVIYHPNHNAAVFRHAEKLPRNVLEVKGISVVIAEIVVGWGGYGQIYTAVIEQTETVETVHVIDFVELEHGLSPSTHFSTFM